MEQLEISKDCELPKGKLEEVTTDALDYNIIEEFQRNDCDISKFWLTPVDVYCYHPPTNTYMRIVLP